MIRNYGLLAGTLNVGLYLLAFFVEKEWFFHPVLPWIGWILFVAIMYRVGMQERAERADYPFQSALRTAFGICAIGLVLFQAFYLLQVYVFDPSLIDLQADVINRTAQTMGQFLGQDLNAMKVSPEDLAFDLGGALLHLARSLVGGFLVSALIALIVKSPAGKVE